MIINDRVLKTSNASACRILLLMLSVLVCGCAQLSTSVPLSSRLSGQKVSPPGTTVNNEYQSSSIAQPFESTPLTHSQNHPSDEKNIAPATPTLFDAAPTESAWLTGSIDELPDNAQDRFTPQFMTAGYSLQYDSELNRIDTVSDSRRDQWHSNDICGPSSNNEEFPCDAGIQESSFFKRLAEDHCNFYSVDSLFGLGVGFGVGALMANTSFDETVHQKFQQSYTSSAFHASKELGNGIYTLPAFAIAWASGNLLEGTPGMEAVGEWGERSIRSLMVGAPPMLAAQYLTGASRPGESSSGSHWKPLQDNNGVSGHSFMGALPFLTAAQVSDDPWMKAVFYAGSTLVPLSRINDDAHYTSQVVLGWWIAFLATRAVDHTQNKDSNWKFAPWIAPGSTGIQAEYRF